MLLQPSIRMRAGQRGAALLFCLIVLLILLAGGVAVIRSMNTSLINAGNLAFKRDLLNQGEQAMAKVLQALAPAGELGAADRTSTSRAPANYSAVELRANDAGIPLVLLKKTELSGPNVANGIFRPTGSPISGRDGVRIYYVIDRLCNAEGPLSTLGAGRCVVAPISAASGGTAGEDRPLPSAPGLYRVSVRVDGPRDTQIFLQSSFSKPE